jgi:uncharacterized protein YbbC (DUF1343 family)
MGSITRRDFMGLSAGVGAFAALGLAGCSVSAGTSGSTQKPGAVKLGVDVLEGDFGILSGKKVGLITNATGVDSKFASTIDVLHASANLTTLFAPEHGIRGAVDAGGTVGQDTDAKTGLPVYSLYGNTKKPTDDMLANVDCLVYDIQDVGARFYTYISTMKYAMQTAAEKGMPFVVLDRPNPLGGDVVQGAVLEAGFESFVGITHVPQRYGLTCGEIAQFMNAEDSINCDLKVVKMSGWSRGMYYEDTGLTCWVLPSPNMPTVDTAEVYPGMCAFEGTNLSEGRGTTKPFELVGAPWVDGQALADKMNSAGLAGAHFRATSFTPTASKFSGQACNGVQTHVTDRSQYDSVLAGFTLLYAIREMYPNDFAFLETNTIDLISGSDYIKNATYTLDQLKDKFESSSKEFKSNSAKYHLY